MLKAIKIKDFAIISELGLNFGPGLNIFTGETGAGKSIVIEALGFVLVALGDAVLIRNGAQKIIVSAVFDSADLPGNLKDKYKITTPEFTVKRELDLKGKSRAWINNLPALVADLDVLGTVLVDFHGQHEHQALFKPAAHLDILDSYANLGKNLQDYRAVYEEEQNLKAKIEALKMSREERARLSELYKYQLEEIEKLKILPGEDADIENNLPKLKHAAKLKEYAEASYTLLSGMEGSAGELLSKTEHMLNDMAGKDSEMAPLAEEMASARAVIEDISATLSSYKDGIDADPDALDELLSRQEVLRKIKLKYGPALEDVLAFAEDLRKRLNDLEDGGQNIQKMETALANSHKKLLSLSEGLFKARKAAGEKLAKLLAAEIAPLGFEQVRFEAAIEHGEDCGPNGADSVEFLFSSNPGSALRPLKNIASGGEISRLMLGLKTVLNGGTPVMVFDEIDAGISGHTGKLVGCKLKKAAEGRQVLCVTHLPQVAVYGAKHFSVAKFVENKNTEVKVEVLAGQAVAQEIARMIGSSAAGSAGFRHAQDLLLEAGSNL